MGMEIIVKVCVCFLPLHQSLSFEYRYSIIILPYLSSDVSQVYISFACICCAFLSLEINPCKEGTSLCLSNAECQYTGPGHHKCVCRKGYTGDGIVCTGTSVS